MSNVTLFLKHTVCIVLIASGVCCAVPPQYTQDQYEFGAGDIIPATTKLSRMSVERIDKALLSYRGRMRRIKATSYATVAGIVGLAGYGVYRAWTGGKSQNVRALEKQIISLQDALSGRDKQDPEKRTNGTVPANPGLTLEQIQQLEAQVRALQGQRDLAFNQQPASNANNGTVWGILTGIPIRAALTLGFIGLVITSGYQVFRVVSGTLDEALQLLWHGYEYWYAGLEEQLRTLMNELRESFYQARKVVQQTSTEQQLIIARQQRRAPLAYEVSSHYRLDIVTLYQRLVGAFERLIALMLIIAPEEHHEVMQQQVAAIIAQFDRFAISLESDLNENTHGLLTHYSNKTLDTYHECIERVTIFLTTYRVHLRK
jgi:hypothetical protein